MEGKVIAGMVGFAARTGAVALGKWRGACQWAGLIWSVVATCFRPRYWTRAVGTELARQIVRMGVQSVPFISCAAFVVGVAVVAQALIWSPKLGRAAMLGPLLVTVLIREVVPILTNLLAIGRSGGPATTELANMKIMGEVRVLSGMGVEPFFYLVVPRVLGMTVSVFCLAVVFVVVSFVSGYLCCALLGASVGSPGSFILSILSSLGPVDAVHFSAKAIVPAMVTGAICCLEGLRVPPVMTAIPDAAARSMTRSVQAALIISALVSLLTYA